MRVPVILAKTLTGLALAALPARALELADAKWGFDGKLIPGRINIVSARFFNPDPQPFDGTVRLVRSGFTGHQGALHEARIFVSPQTYRWVQFQIEPASGHERFELRYPLTPKREEVKAFDGLRPGRGARVMLTDPADTSPIAPRMPSFPAEAFPASVSALEGLDQLALDFLPDWDAPRRQALLDWIHLGGILHLAQDREGKWPVFSGDWAALNSAETRLNLGAGRVVRHPISRRDLTEDVLNAAGYPHSAWSDENQGNPYYMSQDSTTLLQHLRQLIRPRHPWALINLLLLAYIGLVGPGHYFLVRRRNLDYRLSLLMLAGMVAVFSAAFYQIGLRGYRSPSLVLSLSRADVLPGDRAALTQWSQAFTRSSHAAELSHEAPAGAYDTPGSNEPLPATAFNGGQAVLSAKMPINSTLPFVFRGVVRSPALSLEKIPDSDAYRYRGPKPLGALLLDPEGNFRRVQLMTEKEEWSLVPAASFNQEGGQQIMNDIHHTPPANLEIGDGSALAENPDFVNKYLMAYLVAVARQSSGMGFSIYGQAPTPPTHPIPTRQVLVAVAAGDESRVKDSHFAGHGGITVYRWVLPMP